jgi:Clp amino terminal domain, pathogenicity island component/ClpX C4-type zinc finger
LAVFERFTDQSRHVLVVAQEEARLLQHPFIGTEHMLLGLTQVGDGVAGKVLTEMGVSVAEVRERVQDVVGASGGPAREGSPPFTPRAKKVLELALREALRLGAGHIGTEHVLLGLISEGEGIGVQILLSFGIELSDVRQRVIGHMTGAGSGASGGQRGRAIARRVAPTEAAPAEAVVVICSFCGLHPPESGEIVAGHNAFICERCIRQWSLRLHRSRPAARTWISHSPPDVVVPGEPPTDTDEAGAAIGAAYAMHGSLSADGRAALGVEKGADLGWAVTAAKANAPPAFLKAEIAVTVDEIIFVDPEHAAVWFSILVDGSPVLSRHRGDAVLVGSEWMMARSTFCQIMAMGGVTCPPE